MGRRAQGVRGWGRLGRIAFAWTLLWGGGCGAGHGPSPDRSSTGAELLTLEFEHAGHARRALIYRPAMAKEQSPVVLAFHGGGGSAESTRSAYGLEAVADAEGFVVVYPEGVGDTVLGHHFGVWGVGSMLRQRPETEVDDVGFVDALLDRLARNQGIDMTRVYALGISNGSMMALTLACELSPRITAVVGSGATLDEVDCAGARAVPTFYVAGALDPCWPPAGGQCGGCWQRAMQGAGLRKDPVETTSCVSLEDFETQWAAHLGCTGAPEAVTHAGEVECRQFTACRDGASYRTCVVADLGHVWPGGGYGGCEGKEDRKWCGAYIDVVGPRSSQLDLSREAWEFFSRHRLEAATPAG